MRLPHLLAWLAQHPVDALVLQETKLTDDKFPQAELAQAGWHAVWFGQKTYNGVALLQPAAQAAPLDVVRNIPGFEDDQARVIAATLPGRSNGGATRVIGAYFPNGQSPDSDKFVYKLDWLSKLQAWLSDELQQNQRLALLGDFNIAPQDQDVHDPKAWEGQNLVSPPERDAFQELINLGFSDSFRMFEQAPKTFSWWDYRMMGFRRNAGMRIDHILLSEDLKEKCSASVVDKEPRAWEQPSDHAPVIATIKKA